MFLINKTELERWCAGILELAQVPSEDAAYAAQIMLRTDSRGIRTHGITRLQSYVDKLHAGEVTAQPCIAVHESSVGIVTVDADGALGQVAMRHALQTGLKQLEQQPMATILLKECGHLGALGIYALMAAEKGAVCLLAQRTPPLMALEGFNRPAIGNNPIAFSSPVGAKDPMVFDMACSVAARGHVLLRARQKADIPTGWALDKSGQPTVDAQEALEGALLPSAGYKGLGIAMMVECLAGAFTATPASIAGLSSTASVATSGAVGRQSAFMLLIRPEAMAGQYLGEYMPQWANEYGERGGEQARLPGSRGAELERAVRESGVISLDEVLHDELQLLGEKMHFPMPAAQA
jgi:LDH2 family malate/lactate/ureidoglycolate dehydrogenase